jgi:HAD superfamily hydrolase (TIGR01450 family)
MNIEFTESADCFGVEVSDLKNKKLFLLDMDGTIYEEETVFEGTHQLLNLINKIEGGKYVFFTNNSSKSVVDYVKKVNGLGIKAEVDDFFTSAQATILYLKENYPYAKVYCQGTKSLVQELIDCGIKVTEEADDDVAVVLVGFDTELTSQKLRNTCKLLQEKNIPYIATNPDMRCPVNFGFIPDCGSICELLENTTGKKPVYIGKPESTMVDIVRKKYGYRAEETVVIGDRLYTDIAMGLNAGITTICVLTGEATLNDVENGNIKPTYTFPSILNIWNALEFYHK